MFKKITCILQKIVLKHNAIETIFFRMNFKKIYIIFLKQYTYLKNLILINYLIMF